MYHQVPGSTFLLVRSIVFRASITRVVLFLFLFMLLPAYGQFPSVPGIL